MSWMSQQVNRYLDSLSRRQPSTPDIASGVLSPLDAEAWTRVDEMRRESAERARMRELAERTCHHDPPCPTPGGPIVQGRRDPHTLAPLGTVTPGRRTAS